MKPILRSILQVLLLSFTSGLLVGSPVFGQWSYMQSIDIQENQSINHFNKQIILTLNTKCLVDWGMMEAGGDDIRFSYDAGLTDSIGYYIIGGMNTNATKIMIQIDSLQASQLLTVYLHYGNQSAVPGSNLDFLQGPFSATDSVNVPNTNPSVAAGWTRGFKFTCNHDMLVPNIGSNTPNPGSFVATYWGGSGNMISQRTINPASGMTFLYENLNEAVIFTNGNTYVATIHSTIAAGYRYGPPTTTGAHLTYLNMQYANSSTPTTFPTTTLTGQHYGLVDFLYYLIDTNMKAGVTINPLVSTETSQVCTGGSYTFPDNTTLSNITSNVTHISVVTTTGGCDSVVETTLNVIPVDVGVTQTSANTITASAALASYQWVDCNNGFLAISGETGKSFTATANGSYAVVVTQNLCTDTSACIVITSVGLREKGLAGGLEIYPNPASDLVRIDLARSADRVDLEMRNELGQLAMQQAFSNKSALVLDVSKLAPGLYMISIRTEKETVTTKLQIE